MKAVQIIHGSKGKFIDLTVIRRIAEKFPEYTLKQIIDDVKNYPSEKDMDEDEVYEMIKLRIESESEFNKCKLLDGETIPFPNVEIFIPNPKD